MIKAIKYSVAAIAVMILSFGVVVASGPPSDTGETDADTCVSCILSSKISHIEVVDDQAILFHMVGGEIWENRLPYPCHGLKFEGGIRYKTSIDQLCSMDIVTVIRRGTPCGLGYFRPYKKDSEDRVDRRGR